MNDAFDATDSSLSQIIEILKKQCSKLFQDFNSFIADLENQEMNQQYVEDSAHLNSLVLEKIFKKQVKTLILSTSMHEISAADFFFINLRNAMTTYKQTTYSLDIKSFYWYKQFSFLNL